MLTQSDAIVLHVTKHKDNASVLHAYTKENGRVNFIVYNMNGKKSKMSAAMFAPLNIINCVYDYKQQNTLSQIREVSIDNHSFGEFTDNICNNAIRLFISEILFSILNQPLPDEQLFDYIYSFSVYLANNQDPNIHIKFLINLCHLLGFAIDYSNSFSTEEMDILLQLDGDSVDPSISRKMRQNLISKLCQYLEFNIDGFSMPRSLDILQELFD